MEMIFNKYTLAAHSHSHPRRYFTLFDEIQLPWRQLKMIDWPAPEKCSPKLLDQPVIFKGPVGNLSMKDVDQEKVCYFYHVI